MATANMPTRRWMHATQADAKLGLTRGIGLLAKGKICITMAVGDNRCASADPATPGARLRLATGWAFGPNTENPGVRPAVPGPTRQRRVPAFAW